jgi:hypothetical protein
MTEKIILPRTPAEIKLSKTEPTTDELKLYLRTWLKEASESGKIIKLAKIVKALGSDFPKEQTAHPSIYRYVKKLTFGEYTGIYYRLKSWRSDPWCKIEMFVLTVIKNEGEPDEFLQARASYTNLRDLITGEILRSFFADAVDQPVFIPGAWEELFLEELDQAEIKLNADGTLKETGQRSALLKKIGLPTKG